ncbi:MAG: endo alpha-1,4 polygalactosaminidase, partial [Butyrivibrio sp.]|nr:endo alpha-1,4 polygalactosaminidase [Butyrivibrio sp.]
MNSKIKVGFRVLSAVLILSSLLLTSCGSSYSADNEASKAGQVKGVSRQPYGVYLSCEYEELPANLSCDEVVIDAQYFTAQEIANLKKKNGKVYSYLNVGSLEDFREYFKKFDRLILGAYENWEGEYWVDVSDSKSQDFLVDEIASDMLKKGIDGFFID